jgi:uncharacterized protein (TIGR03084 family)
MILPQISDFLAEVAELDALLATLAPDDWTRPTGFKGWTSDDIVRHLHIGDRLGLAAATDKAAYDSLAADIAARRASFLSRVAETAERLGGLSGPALRQRWRDGADELAAALAAKDPSARLPWSGPGMGVRMFATARQMEVWAHGQAIYDLLGRDRPPASPRLRNIAEIGVRTYAWTFRNRGLEPPGPAPDVHLAGPAGASWDWPGATDASVTGDAVAFCQVVTQTRNVADTTLLARGASARRWLEIAQCFAGPPEDPPPPGTRRPRPRGTA